eukprot:6210809-Pleurochrysis_carterae.AAC.3
MANASRRLRFRQPASDAHHARRSAALDCAAPDAVCRPSISTLADEKHQPRCNFWSCQDDTLNRTFSLHHLHS